MGARKTTEQFIEDAKAVHGDKYDYSLVEYVTNSINVKITCKVHGVFKQQPANHLSGANCPKCSKILYAKLQTRTRDKFIEECRKTHGDKYDYTITKYKTCKDNVEIVCKKHGIFEILADNHQRGQGCQACKKEELTEQCKVNFIKKAEELHNNKFNYSLINYVNNNTKVDIICPTHGVFSQMPLNHLQGNGCNKCNVEKRNTLKITTEEFIVKASNIHQNKYTYDNVEYSKMDSDIFIGCKEHGLFKQKVYKHLQGSGCQKCSNKENGKKIRSNTETFLNKMREIHGDTYDYSLVDYIHSREKIKIICKHHGIFEQKPVNHMKGSGCKECSNLINIYKKEDYIKLSKTAIIYIVILEQKGERFYKIGKTKNTVHQRLSNNISAYNFTVINEYEGDSGHIFDLEIELHKKYHKYKYLPQNKFAGHTECYNLDLPIQEIIDTL